MQPEELAKLFHETYERLAPEYGYETREETRTDWFAVPEQNRELMIATAAVVIEQYRDPEVKELMHLVHRLVPVNWRERERRQAMRSAYQRAEEILGCPV